LAISGEKATCPIFNFVHLRSAYITAWILNWSNASYSCWRCRGSGYWRRSSNSCTLFEIPLTCIKCLWWKMKFFRDLGSLVCKHLAVGRTISGILCPRACWKRRSTQRHLWSISGIMVSYPV
jgi:hypothetical protein